MIVWSYGGGTQSIAIAILIAEKRLPVPDMIVFADTGKEMQETWDYMYDYVQPLLSKTVYRAIHFASHSWANVDDYGKNGDVLMPVYTQKGKLPTFCSKEWKTYVVRRYLRSWNVDTCTLWLGMSTDEVERLKHSDVKWITNSYPLCALPDDYGIRMNRIECRQYILNYGFPNPPQSSCIDCPHRKNDQWKRLKMYSPSDFSKAIMRDKELRANDKQGGVFLHESRKPLDEIDFDKPSEQLELFCDSGFCFT